MKKTILIALILAMALSLFACEETSEDGNTNVAWNAHRICEGVTLVKVVDVGSYEILVHEETGVMYLSLYGSYKSGLTVMLDANGDPLIWEGEV
jgi:hypothetical protein